jgi:hypothetical protein
MNFRKIFLPMTMSVVLLLVVNTQAQHLWWGLENEHNALCLYGEITVLATHPSIYYCGANWHPGEAAGGYCGIQDNSPTERRTIFSIWDTSPELHPQVTEADAKTQFGRFGGEGEGGHTHMLWNWKAGETFQFFVQKQPGTNPDTTDTRYYIFDRDSQKWRHSATITSPNGGKSSVATIGGGLNSFLENFRGTEKAEPKLALYRLWLGSSIDTLKCLTHAHGDGTWGQLHDAFFLAEGDTANLDAVFAELERQYGKPLLGGKGRNFAPISDRPIPASVIAALKNPPRAPKTINQP